MGGDLRLFQLSPEDVKVRLFDDAPPALDLKQASTEDARRFGWFPPAGPETSAEYRSFWSDKLSSGSTYVKPRFSVRKTRTVIEAQRRALLAVQYDNWAGIGLPSGDVPLVAVWGSWKVPHIGLPSASSGDAVCINSIWLGLDGFQPPFSDILQIGVDLDVQRSAGSVTTGIYPWYEWWQGPSYYFDFPVNTGDVLSCAISFDHGASSGTVYMHNKTDASHTSFQVLAPGATTAIGNCAEWIVERQKLDDANPDYTHLCEFGSIEIGHAFASTSFPPKAGAAIRHAGEGTLIEMTTSDQKAVLATTTLINPTTLRIHRQ